MTTPIATLAEIKAFADVTGTATDSVLTLMTPGVLGAMGSYCNRGFTSATKNGSRDGNGAQRLQLVQYPITAVSALFVDGALIPYSLSVDQPGYWFPAGGRTVLLRGNYRFNMGERNVAIIYTGGYGDGTGQAGADVAPWPDELKLAFLMTITTWFRKRKTYGFTSKSLAGESVSVAGGGSGMAQGLPDEVCTILQNFVNVVPETIV